MEQVEQIGPESEEGGTNGVGEAEQVAAPEPQVEAEYPPAAEQPEPKAIVVSKEDRLMAENTNLRMMVVAAQVRDAQHALKEAIDRQNQAHQAMISEQARLEQKYGVDLNTHTIRDADGVVIPRNLPGAPQQR